MLYLIHLILSKWAQINWWVFLKMKRIQSGSQSDSGLFDTLFSGPAQTQSECVCVSNPLCFFSWIVTGLVMYLLTLCSVSIRLWILCINVAHSNKWVWIVCDSEHHRLRQTGILTKGEILEFSDSAEPQSQTLAKGPWRCERNDKRD